MKHHLTLALLLASCGVDDREYIGWNPEEPGEVLIPSIPEPEVEPSCVGKTVLELSDGALWQTSMDGTQSELFRFGATTGANPQNIHISAWRSAGDFHAVTATVPTSNSEYFYEVVLISNNGNLLHHAQLPATSSPTIHLSAEGSLAVELWQSESYVVQADGPQMSLGRYHPMAPQYGEEILVRDQPLPHTPGAKFGWLNIQSNTFRALQHTPKDVHYLTPVGDKLLYLSSDEKLVLEGPATYSTVHHKDNLYVYSPRPSGEPLKGDFVIFSDADAHFRADLRGGNLVVEPIMLPDGHATWPMDLQVRLDGAILATRTVSEGLEAIISEDLGTTWTAIAAPIPNRRQDFFPAIAQYHANGNVLLMEITVSYGYYLESAQALTPTESSQILTHGVYTGGPYDFNGIVDFAKDGGCAVMWRHTAAQESFTTGPVDLVAIDYSTHEHILVRSAERVSQLRFAP